MGLQCSLLPNSGDPGKAVRMAGFVAMNWAGPIACLSDGTWGPGIHDQLVVFPALS